MCPPVPKLHVIATVTFREHALVVTRILASPYQSKPTKDFDSQNFLVVILTTHDIVVHSSPFSGVFIPLTKSGVERCAPKKC